MVRSGGVEGRHGKKCSLCQNIMLGVCAADAPSRTEAAEGNLPTYWPRNRFRGCEKQGQWVFRSGLQTVCESIIENNELYSILYSVAKNVPGCWSMYEWVCLSVTGIVCERLWWDRRLQVSLCYHATPLLPGLLSNTSHPLRLMLSHVVFTSEVTAGQTSVSFREGHRSSLCHTNLTHNWNVQLWEKMGQIVFV